MKSGSVSESKSKQRKLVSKTQCYARIKQSQPAGCAELRGRRVFRAISRIQCEQL